jgi:hypothetical protein
MGVCCSVGDGEWCFGARGTSRGGAAIRDLDVPSKQIPITAG